MKKRILAIASSIIILFAGLADASLGGSAEEPGFSCKELLNEGASVGDGIYWIDPDGAGGNPSFQVYCDMTTAGGGWILGLNSLEGQEPPTADMTSNSGSPGLTVPQTRDLSLLAIAQTAEIRHQLVDTANSRIFDASYSGRYHEPLPAWSSWTTKPAHTFGAEVLLDYHFGKSWTSSSQDNDQWPVGNCAVQYGTPWYYGACFATIPVNPTRTSISTAGPFTSVGGGGYRSLQRYSIWVRESTISVRATALTGGTLDFSTPSPVSVPPGNNAVFRFNANTGYHIASVTSTCGPRTYTNTDNSVNAYFYTTDPVTAECSVTASFALNQYQISTVSTNGTISPATKTILHGSATQLTLLAFNGHYFTSASGCEGTALTNTNQLISTLTYTTGAVTADCTVNALFSLKTYTVSAVLIDRTSPEILYAGLDGRGIYKSSDGGANWMAATAQPSDLRIKQIVRHPTGQTLYAASYGSGIFFSTDAADNWTACANTGLIGLGLNVLTLTIDASGHLYAGTEDGIFVSTNDCATWAAMNNGLPE